MPRNAPCPSETRPKRPISDHALPMKDQMKIWIEDVEDVLPARRPSGSSGTSSAGPTKRAGPRSRSAAQPRLARMPPGPDEHHHDEDDEGDDVAHLGRTSTPPIEMISLMMNEATKAPTMLPSPPSTQIMKVSGPNGRPK